MLPTENKASLGRSLLIYQFYSIWKRITSGSANRRILGASVTIAGLSCLVKLTSVAKESMVAKCYGTGNAFDAFVIALLIPAAIISLVSGSLNAALIPTYIQLRTTEGHDSASRLYTTVLCLNLALLAALIFVVGATARWWLPLIASGFGSSKLSLATSLVYWSLPMVLVAGLSTTWGAVLNAGEKFGVVALAPVSYPIAIIATLWAAGGQRTIFALVVGSLVGAVIEATVVGGALARRGHPLLPRWHGLTRAARQVCGQYGATIAGSFLMSAMTITDQAMAAMLGPRSNSALSYANKIPALIINLGAFTLGAALLPQFSAMVAEGRRSEFKRSIRTYLKICALFGVPISLLLIAFARPLTAFIFQRGAFSPNDTDIVVRIQFFYLLQLPLVLMATVLVRAMTALRRNQILTLIAVAQVILNGVLNYVFMRHFGVPGIAFSTLCVSIIAFCAIALCLFLGL